MAKASKSHTSDTDNDANSGSEDLVAMRAELAELRAGKGTAEALLANERQARRTAELSTMSAQEREIVAQQEACDSRLAEAETELTSLEDQIATLTDEGGRGKEVAALTRKMTTASARLQQEEGRKSYLEGQREKITGANKQARESVPADAEVVADGTPMSVFATKTQAWLRAHPQSKSDVQFMKKARHYAAEAINIQGLTDESPEYYEFVEEKLGLTASPTAEDGDDGEGEEVDMSTERYVPEKPQKPAAGPGAMSSAAPPTRQTPSGNGGGQRRAPTLTAEEREVALSLYPNIKTDADKLVRYAEGKRFMKDRTNQHFRNN